MINQPYISRKLFRSYGIITMVLATFFILSTTSAHSQMYKKRSSRGKKGGKIEFKRNIVWLDGMGSSQVVGIKYERILMFGSHFSVRPDLGVTPFMLDHKYNCVVGRSITPITGLGFYLHFNPGPIRIGVGASVLHDIFFEGTPETTTDTVGTGKSFPASTYRARIMPYIVFEYTIKERYCIRAGFTPIIDPANDAQTTTYFSAWATLGFGYKFGR